MPFINGRFYANPAYGRTLERARRSNSGGIWSEDFPEQDRGIDEEGSHRRDATQAVQHSGRAVHPKHHGTDDFDAATTTAGITNQIYNETASLRPTSESGNGSDVELQRARLAMAHVIHNRAAIKMPGGLASDQLNSREEEGLEDFPPKRTMPLVDPVMRRGGQAVRMIPRMVRDISTSITDRQRHRLPRAGRRWPYSGPFETRFVKKTQIEISRQNI